MYEDQTQENAIVDKPPATVFDKDRFVNVASCGDLSEVEHLIAAGIDVNLTDEHGNTALSLAALGGHTAIVNLLIEKKADVNYANERFLRRTALTMASRRGHVDVVKKLLDEKADVSHVEIDGETALSCAVTHGDMALAIMLFEAGACVESLSKTDLSVFKSTLNEVIKVINASLDKIFYSSFQSDSINDLVKKINGLTVRLEGDNFYFKKTREEVKSHFLELMHDEFSRPLSSIGKDEYNAYVSGLEYIRSHLEIIQEDEVKKEIESLISKRQSLIETKKLPKKAKGPTTQPPSDYLRLFSRSTPKVSQTSQQINRSSKPY